MCTPIISVIMVTISESITTNITNMRSSSLHIARL